MYLKSLLFLLCAVSLFLHIDSPVIAIEDKWYASIILLLLFLMVNSAWCIRTISWKPNKLISGFCIIVSICCFILAIYGILQYAHILPAHSPLGITGNFDNPAGYAASLCAGFQSLFYIYTHYRSKLIKQYSILAGLCIISAITLSGSRTGIFSITIMCACWLLLNTKIRFRPRYRLLFPALLLILLTVLYFYKKDSADGRLLIWQCTGQMIKDKPFFGHGDGGFLAGYMNYQAIYFAQHPDSTYVLLADNIKHPFNEYLLILVNYGMVGLLIILVLAFFLWKCYKQNPCLETNTALVCLAGIATFACFSYPLSYPFVWIMMLFSFYILISYAGYPIKISPHLRKVTHILTICLSLIVLTYTTRHILYKITWSQTAKEALIEQTDVTFARYQQLLPALRNNHLFLYNYAAELNCGGLYEHSRQIAEKCNAIWADYELQLLMGDNCINSMLYEEAETHFKLASNMCPVRLMPLYELMKIYQLNGQEDKARNVARRMIKKPIKVHSPKVLFYKKEAEKYLSEHIP